MNLLKCKVLRIRFVLMCGTNSFRFGFNPDREQTTGTDWCPPLVPRPAKNLRCLAQFVFTVQRAR